MFLRFFGGDFTLSLAFFFGVRCLIFSCFEFGGFFLGLWSSVVVMVSPSDRLVLLLDGAGQAAGEDDANQL